MMGLAYYVIAQEKATRETLLEARPRPSGSLPGVRRGRHRSLAGLALGSLARLR